MNNDIKNLDDVVKEVNVILTQLESLKDDFILSIEKFADIWADKKTEKTIINNIKQSRILGENGFKEIRDKLSKLLIKEVPVKIKEVLNKEKPWLHKFYQDISEKDFGRYNNDTTNNDKLKELETTINNVLEFCINPLLIKYGYTPNTLSVISWSTEMNAIMKNYSNLFNKLIELKKKQIILEKRRDENEIKLMWENSKTHN